MNPELFNTCVDWLIKSLAMFALAVMTFGLLSIPFDWVRHKVRKRKKYKFITDEEFQEVLESTNRKTQIINKQLVALDRCSEELNRLIYIFQKSFSQYEKTADRLSNLDNDIHHSTASIQKSIALLDVRDKEQQNKADTFICMLEECLSQYSKTTDRLKSIDKNIHGSANSISKSTLLLDTRDKELKEEIANLLYLEKYPYKKPEIHLDKSIESLDLSASIKCKLRVRNCKTIGDAMNLMLQYQRKGLLQLRGVGKHTVYMLETRIEELGLIKIQNGLYVSTLQK